MGQCFSSCLRVTQDLKTPPRSQPQPLNSPPTPIDVYNVIVEYDKNTNFVKNKTFAQKNFSSNKNHVINEDGDLVPKQPKTPSPNLGSDKRPQIQDSLFEKYNDSDNKELILAEGMGRFCEDLGLDPEDYKVLSLAWKFQASQMSRFTKSEFIEGMKSLDVSSLGELSEKLEEVAEESQKEFRDFYKWAFSFALEPPQRLLPSQMAVPLWTLLFQKHKSQPALLLPWLQFLETRNNCSISRDTWDLLLNFFQTFPNTSHLSDYTDNEAWPSIFDEFVESQVDLSHQQIPANQLSPSISN